MTRQLSSQSSIGGVVDRSHSLLALLEKGPNIELMGTSSGWTVALGFKFRMAELSAIPGVIALTQWPTHPDYCYVLLSHDDLSKQPDETTQEIRVMIAPWCRVTLWIPAGQVPNNDQIGVLVASLDQDVKMASDSIAVLLEAIDRPSRVLWFSEQGGHDVGLDYIHA